MTSRWQSIAPSLPATVSDQHRERLPEVGALGEAPRGAPDVGDYFQVLARGEPAPQLLQALAHRNAHLAPFQGPNGPHSPREGAPSGWPGIILSMIRCPAAMARRHRCARRRASAASARWSPSPRPCQSRRAEGRDRKSARPRRATHRAESVFARVRRGRGTRPGEKGSYPGRPRPA